jgi:hypothetical protein
MNLSTRLTGDFSATVRNRGKNYYWQGRVRIRHGSTSEVGALVRGSHNSYEVSLDWENGVLIASCDCPYFESDGPCKHIWATILAADARGHLSAASDADLVLDFGDIEDEDWEMPAPQSHPPVAVPKPPPPPRPPVWKNLITGVASRGLQAAQLADQWPSKREVLYIVDVPGSGSSGNVVLNLAMRDRKAEGVFTRVTPLALKRNQIAQLPPKDREMVSALAGGVHYSGWGYTRGDEQVPESYLIAHPLAGSVIPLAARGGRCYLRNGRELHDLIPLTWDENGPWEFGIEMRRCPKGWALAGALRRGDERINLAAATLVTQGGLVLTPVALRRSRKTRPSNGSLSSVRLAA